MLKRKQRKNYERYDISCSPFSQKPTQRDLANILGMSRDGLRRHADYKEECIVRRTEEINGKQRDLAYPVGPLRVVHEKLKFHLNKIKQPDYLFSPRKNRGQRDNAAYHAANKQYLTLDLKQFYPSTSRTMIKSWLRDELGMYEDVAGLFAELATVDGVASFGSPLTPVLVSLVHRKMFNEIAQQCIDRGLVYSLWVDDMTISGDFVSAELLTMIREIIAKYGLKSHKIARKTGNRAVFITGIGVVGEHLVAPQTLHNRIKGLWDDFHDAKTDEERESVIQKLLAQMGTLRHIVGAKSEMGRKTADRMNSLRQKRDKWRRRSAKNTTPKEDSIDKEEPQENAALPWD